MNPPHPNPHIRAVTPISSSQTHLAGKMAISRRSWEVFQSEPARLGNARLGLPDFKGLLPTPASLGRDPPALYLRLPHHPRGCSFQARPTDPAGWLLLIGTGRGASLPLSPPGGMLREIRIAGLQRRGGEGQRTPPSAPQGRGGGDHLPSDTGSAMEPEGTSCRSHPPTRLLGAHRPSTPAKAVPRLGENEHKMR